MAGYKKKIKQIKEPTGNSISQGGDPDQYYSKYPSWNFASCDKDLWCFSSDRCGELFWIEILPYLQNIETRNWNEILMVSKKQNHSIDVKDLNKIAPSTFTKMNNDQQVSLDVLARICIELKCGFDDIVKIES